MDQAQQTEPLSTRRTSRTAALLLASFGAMLAFLDVTIVNVAFPSIRESFPDTSLGDLSWVLNSYNIVFAAVLVAAGRLADVFGRRRTFALGIFVFTVASGLCAIAPDVGVLIAARVLQALGAGLLVPASLALVVEAFPPERRAHAIGLWGASAAFAAGIGPPLGGALVELDSWRLAFLINLPLGIVALVVIKRVLVESRAPGRKRLPDLRGAALLGGAVALLTLAVVQGPEWGWTSSGVVASFVGAVVLGLACGWSSRRHPVPVLDPALLRVPAFAVANVATFVAGMGFYAYLLNNILWLTYVWDYSILRAGLAVAPGAFVAAVVAGVLGKVADSRGHRVVVVPGALVWAGAFLWYYVVVGPEPDFLGTWLPGQVLSGIGVGATLPIVAGAALAAVPGGRYATASAVVSSTRQLGAVIGIALLVVIVGTPSAASAEAAFRDGWVLSIACFAVTALVVLLLRHRSVEEVEALPPPVTPQVHARPLPAPTPSGSLGRSPVLANLPTSARESLLDSSPLVTVEGGSWLFQEGDETDAMYVVQSGRLDVIGAGGVVRELGAGDAVGELGVLTGAPRSAGIRARRDSVLWRVTPARFAAVLDRDTAALHALTRSLAGQLQSARTGTDEPSRLPGVVAVVGVGDGAPVLPIAEALRTELAVHLRVLLTRSMTAEQLYRAEPDHDRVLLVADDPAEPFHPFSLRSADRVVVVAASDSIPPVDLGPWTGECYVLLVGPAPAAARLAEWHDALGPRFLAVAAAGDLAPAVDNLAARLGGRSIGVAVAGGGARSFSAIGVIEELLDAGFRIDRLAGCSVGSVVVGLFATGRDAAAVDATCYEEFVRRNPFNDYRLPAVSLSRGKKVAAASLRHFADTTFEQLPRELTLVSTDLLSRRLTAHRRGSVADAVLASLALPGLFPPRRIGDSLHVDGGVLDNLPVRPLTELEEGPVVAVNIAAAAPVSTRSGPPRMPSMGETLLRTMLMGGTSTLDDAKRQATLMVTPDTRGIGLLEFHQIDRARDAGRVAGRAVAEALTEQLRAPTAVPRPRSRADRTLDLDAAGTRARVLAPRPSTPAP